jgi:hypothetical protein
VNVVGARRIPERLVISCSSCQGRHTIYELGKICGGTELFRRMKKCVRPCAMHNLELLFVGESDEMAGEPRDRRPDDERCPHHAPARLLLRRRSEIWPVARGVRWGRCLLLARVPLGPAERTGGECYTIP